MFAATGITKFVWLTDDFRLKFKSLALAGSPRQGNFGVVLELAPSLSHRHLASSGLSV